MFARSWPTAILHIDCDAFFASCEQALHPEYRGRPVICGKERGIVAAASYEAKRLGVSRGTPLWEVKKIIPDAIIVPSDYESYSLFSKRMFEVIRRFTGTVEEYSIDEAFADITGYRRALRGSYPEIALRIKDAIQADLGITVSVGLAATKALAKVGSKYRKPNGFTPISNRDIPQFLATLTPEQVWGIGERTAAYCAQLRLRTALDFARQTERQVTERFTKPHVELWRELNGESVWPVTAGVDGYGTAPQQSIGKTRTFTPPSRDKSFVFSQLLKNVENACIKARRHGQLARSASVFLKTQEFRYVGMELSFSRATAYPIDMVPAIRAAFEQLHRPRTEYRATGVTLCNLQSAPGAQLDLFEPACRVEKMERLYGAIDALAARFGKHAVFHAGSAHAHRAKQHEADRGDVAQRKQTRLRGETERQHLTLPVLQGVVR